MPVQINILADAVVGTETIHCTESSIVKFRLSERRMRLLVRSTIIIIIIIIIISMLHNVFKHFLPRQCLLVIAAAQMHILMLLLSQLLDEIGILNGYWAFQACGRLVGQVFAACGVQW